MSVCPVCPLCVRVSHTERAVTVPSHRFRVCRVIYVHAPATSGLRNVRDRLARGASRSARAVGRLGWTVSCTDTTGNGTTRDRSLLRVLDRRPASLAHWTVLSLPIEGVPRWLTTRRIYVRSHASPDA